MTSETEAFLLQASPCRESDLVVVLLTSQHGRLSLVARGARASKRRFGGALDYFHLLRAEFRPGRSGLGRLAAVECLRPFDVSRAGVDAYWAGSHVLEVARLGSREGAPDDALFRLVEAALGALDRGSDPRSLARVFQVKALGVLGYGLTAGACAACGAPWLARPARRHGGAVRCAPCAGPGDEPLSAGALRTLEAADGLPLDRLASLRVSAALDRELAPLLEAALAAALGAAPRSQVPPP
ncbi:MAG: DNA repair protein RecO [Deferrisomatales bacterium]